MFISGSLLEKIPAVGADKTCVCGFSIDGIVGSNPIQGMKVYFFSVVCCEVKAAETGRSRVCMCVSLIVMKRNNNRLYLR
jgi:hypothetical protein